MEPDHFRLHAKLEDRHWWFVARRRIVGDVVRTILPPSRRKRIVDWGCGTGATVAALASDYDAIGIDASELAIDLARDRFPSCEFATASALSEGAQLIDSADFVLLLDVLEHIPDDAAFLADLVGCMKTSARVLITVPAKRSLWGAQDEAVGHQRRYEMSDLESLWQNLPVRRVMATYYNARLYSLVYIFRRIGRMRQSTSGEANTDFWLPAEPMNHLLTAVFAGEARALTALAVGRRAQGFRTGVSLMAVLEKRSAR